VLEDVVATLKLQQSDIRLLNKVHIATNGVALGLQFSKGSGGLSSVSVKLQSFGC
jgi:hypothetical protein